MKIRVYAKLEPGQMFEAGKNAGLSDEAAEYFRHCTELEVELYVDPENGAVCGGKLIEDF